MNYQQLLEKNYKIHIIGEDSEEIHVSIQNQNGQQVRYEIYDKDGKLISVTINIYQVGKNEDWMVVKTDERGNILDGHAPGLDLGTLKK